MECAYDRKFQSSALALSPTDYHRIGQAVEDYLRNPNAPGLNLEKLKGNAGRQRLHTIRASQELRVLLAREGSTTVFLRAGQHDAIYRLAEKTRFAIPRAGAPGLIPIARNAQDVDGTVLRASSADRKAAIVDAASSILAHWTDGELTRAGFDRPQVGLLRQANQDDLLEVWPDIGEETLDLVLQLSEQTPEEHFQDQLLANEDAENQRFREAIVERGALAGLSPLLSSEELKRLLAAPIEDWMIFLHPAQRELAERRFAGPARVRGSAGTGKTVVALHRAAALAKRYAKRAPDGQRPAILFTTYIKSLPPVFENLYRRLPTAIPNAVEFINIDKLANRICREAGERPVWNADAARKAFNDAHNTVVRRNTPLAQAAVTRAYLREEIEAVIKGRGLQLLDDYLALQRTGRRTPFTAPMREQLWALKEEWDRGLKNVGVTPFEDVAHRAAELAQRRPDPTYRCAIVDEAQDLSLVRLALVRALVQDDDPVSRPDALFIAGDGAQRIYPGGFTLAQAGLDVRGRSSVLRINYRNTKEIISAAMACTGSAPITDLDEEYARGDAEAETDRGGARPRLVTLPNFQDQVAWTARQVRELVKQSNLSLGDIGVLAATNALAKKATEGLQAESLPCQRLEQPAPSPTGDRIRIGTFHRAKGLEFKVVFLLGLSEGRFPTPPRKGESDDERLERQALQLSQLFVAMTRARDGLFLLCSKTPTDALIEGIEHMKEVQT